MKISIVSIMNKEPKTLKNGKEFHKKIQTEWLDTAEGEVEAEKQMIKQNGRKGRMDVFIKTEETYVSIAEIKMSDWDVMTIKNLHRNVRRQIRQIWSYIDSQLEQKRDVTPGIIFSNRPKKNGRLDLIEQLFGEEGITVVWDDESIEECLKRSSYDEMK